MPTRRGFLAAMVATAVLDPERLLWVPGKKLISIPEVSKFDGRIMVRVTEHLWHDRSTGRVWYSVTAADEIGKRNEIVKPTLTPFTQVPFYKSRADGFAKNVTLTQWTDLDHLDKAGYVPSLQKA